MVESDTRILNLPGNGGADAHHEKSNAGVWGTVLGDAVDSAKIVKEVFTPTIKQDKGLDLNSNVSSSVIGQSSLGAGIFKVGSNLASSLSLLVTHPGIISHGAQDIYHTVTEGTTLQRKQLLGHTIFFGAGLLVGGGEVGMARAANTVDLATARAAFGAREAAGLTFNSLRAAADTEIIGANAARFARLTTEVEPAMGGLSTTVEGLAREAPSAARVLPRTSTLGDLAGTVRVAPTARLGEVGAGESRNFLSRMLGRSSVGDSTSTFSFGNLTGRPVVSTIRSVAPSSLTTETSALRLGEAFEGSATADAALTDYAGNATLTRPINGARAATQRFTLRSLRSVETELGETSTLGPRVPLTSTTEGVGSTSRLASATEGVGARIPSVRLGNVSEAGLGESALTSARPVGTTGTVTENAALRAVVRTTRHTDEAVGLATERINQLPQDILGLIKSNSADETTLKGIAERLNGKVSLSDSRALQDIRPLVGRLSQDAQEQVTRLLGDTSASIRDARLYETGLQSTRQAAADVESFPARIRELTRDTTLPERDQEALRTLQSESERLVPGRNNTAVLDRMTTAAESMSDGTVKNALQDSLSRMGQQLTTAQEFDRTAGLLRAGINETTDFRAALSDLAKAGGPDADALKSISQVSERLSSGADNTAAVEDMRKAAAKIEDLTTRRNVLDAINQVERPLETARMARVAMHQVEELSTDLTADLAKSQGAARAPFAKLSSEAENLRVGADNSATLQNMRDAAGNIADTETRNTVLQRLTEIQTPLEQAGNGTRMLQSARSGSDLIGVTEDAATQATSHIKLQLTALQDTTNNFVRQAVGPDVERLQSIAGYANQLSSDITAAERTQLLGRMEADAEQLSNASLKTRVGNAINDTKIQLTATNEIQEAAVTSKQVVQQLGQVSNTLDDLAGTSSSKVVQNLANQSRFVAIGEDNSILLGQMKDSAAALPESALKTQVTQAIERMEAPLSDAQRVQKVLADARDTGIVRGDSFAGAASMTDTIASSVRSVSNAADALAPESLAPSVRSVSNAADASESLAPSVRSSSSLGANQAASESSLQLFRDGLTQQTETLAGQTQDLSKLAENAAYKTDLQQIASDYKALATSDNPAGLLQEMKLRAGAIKNADLQTDIFNDLDRVETRFGRAQDIQDSLTANAETKQAVQRFGSRLDELGSGDAAVSGRFSEDFKQLKTMSQDLRAGEDNSELLAKMRTQAKSIDDLSVQRSVLNALDNTSSSFTSAETAQAYSNAALSSERLAGTVDSIASQAAAKPFASQFENLAEVSSKISAGADNSGMLSSMREFAGKIDNVEVRNSVLDAVNDAKAPLERAQQVQETVALTNRLSVADRFTQTISDIGAAPEVASRFESQITDLRTASQGLAAGENNASTIRRMRDIADTVSDESVKVSLKQAINEAESPLLKAQRLEEFNQAQVAARATVTDLQPQLADLKAVEGATTKDISALERMETAASRLSLNSGTDNTAAARALNGALEDLSPSVRPQAEALVTNTERSLSAVYRTQEVAATDAMSQQFVRDVSAISTPTDLQTTAIARLQEGAASLRWGADNSGEFERMSQAVRDLPAADQVRTGESLNALQSAYSDARRFEAAAASGQRADMAAADLRNSVQTIAAKLPAESANDSHALEELQRSISGVSSAQNNTQAFSDAREALARISDAKPAGQSLTLNQQLAPQLQATQDDMLAARINAYELYDARVARNIAAITTKDTTVPLAERIAQTQKDIAIMRSMAPAESQTATELENLSHNLEALNASANMRNSQNFVGYLKDWYTAYAARPAAQVERAERALASGNDAQAQAIIDQMVLTGKDTSRAGLKALDGSPVQGLVSERAQFWDKQHAIEAARRAEQARDLLPGWVEGLSPEKQAMVQRAIERTILAKQNFVAGLSSSRVWFNRATMVSSATSPFIGPMFKLTAPYLDQPQVASRTGQGDAAIAGSAGSEGVTTAKDGNGNGNGNGNGSGAASETQHASAATNDSSAQPSVQVAQSRTADGDGGMTTGGGGPGASDPSNQATPSRRPGITINPIPEHAIGASFQASAADRVWLNDQHAGITWYGNVQSIYPVELEASRTVFAQQYPIKFSTTSNTTDQSKISTTAFDFGKIGQPISQADLLADAKFNRTSPFASSVGMGSSLATSWMDPKAIKRGGILRTVSAAENDHQHNLDMLEATIEHRDGPSVGISTGTNNDPNQPVLAGAAVGTTDPSGSGITGGNQDPQTAQTVAQTGARQEEV